MKLARRHFINSAIVASSSLASARGQTQETEETRQTSDTIPRRVVVGIMGMQRGLALAKAFARQANVEVKYVCDVDRSRLERAAMTMQNDMQCQTEPVGDFRRILDDDQVDALVCAAPNHWHGPATILACAAGKHVYVEKPASHNPAEGEWMVEAAKKHNRLVQVGMQRRSNPVWIEAIEKLHAGLIGKIYLAKSWYSNSRGSIGQLQHVEVPDYLNYDLWQGPAAERPYSPSFVHYNWHWHWNWGNGEIGNNGVHTLDLCRWGLGVDFPQRTESVGGRFVFDDSQETPDTNTANFQFASGSMVSWEGHSCHRTKSGFVTFYGSDGMLEIDENGANRQYDRKGKLLAEVSGSPHSLRDHIANFLDCIRREKSSDQLNASVDDGHKSALLCHLANIAYRKERAVKSNPVNGRITDGEAMELWQREYREQWRPKV